VIESGCFLPVYVDPHRHDTDVIAEVHAVDHEGHEVELGEVTG
jgi:hypothetical protein